MGIDDKLARLEEKLAKTPVNKATEKDRARIKSQIAKLEDQKEQRAKETGGGYEGYSVRKTGDATVALVGPPSVGKSTLLNQVTNADSETGAYEFTTLDVIPGILQHRGAHIQLLDVPGLIGGAAGGRGRGKEVLSVVRNSDAILMMTAPEKLDGFDQMEEELFDAGIRLNTTPPNVKISKTDKGGLAITTPTKQTHLDAETIETVLRERGYVNARVVLREDVTLDRLIDAISHNRRYLPGRKVVNKTDALSSADKAAIKDEHDPLFISAKTGQGIEELKDMIYDALQFMQIYMKKPGKEPDRDEPLIIEQGATIREVCEKLAGDMEDTFDYARIWGDSAKFPEQKVGGEHVLQDEDVVELHTR